MTTKTKIPLDLTQRVHQLELQVATLSEQFLLANKAQLDRTDALGAAIERHAGYVVEAFKKIEAEIEALKVK